MGADSAKWDPTSGPRRIQELEDQLSATKNKWQLQVRRTRQLVAAFQLKLEEKDVQVQTMRRAVDAQMRGVTASLLQVEATLRKEKRLVLQTLGEKEQIIKDQRFEIGRLKALNKELLREKLQSSYSSQLNGQQREPSPSHPARVESFGGGFRTGLHQEDAVPQRKEQRMTRAERDLVAASPVRSATGNKRWRSDSDVLTPTMKVVRVGSSVSFLLNKSECSESHSSNEDIGPISSLSGMSSQMNGEEQPCSIVATISRVLNTSSASSKGNGTPPARQNNHDFLNHNLNSTNSFSSSSSSLSPPSMLDDSLDQSDSGFFSSSGQRTPESGAVPPTPPLPARGAKPPWIPPKPDHLVAKLRNITNLAGNGAGSGSGGRAAWCKSEPNLCKEDAAVPAQPNPAAAGSVVAAATSVGVQKKTGGILKKTSSSASAPNLFRDNDDRKEDDDDESSVLAAAAVARRNRIRNARRLVVSTSGGDLNEGVVRANFEEFHLDSIQMLPGSPPLSASSTASTVLSNKSFSSSSSSSASGDGRPTGDGAETSGCETEEDDDGGVAGENGVGENVTSGTKPIPPKKPGSSSQAVDTKLVHFSGSYEKFLEATGLSQKSLLVQTHQQQLQLQQQQQQQQQQQHRPTPHNNHRSVVKPKDVKNRSKMNKLSSVFDSAPSVTAGGQSAVGLVKYWTEPYL